MTNTRRPVTDRDDFPTADRYRELVLEFRRHLRARGLSDGTVRNRLHYLGVLHAAHPDLLAVTLQDLEQLLSSRRNTTAPETRKSMRVAWRLFYAWALERGYIDTNPADELKPIRIPRRAARIASDSQLLEALAVATLPEKAAILLGRDACLRLSEIAKLHTDDRESGTLYIVGKGEHARIVPITDELALVLDRLERLQGAGYYFPGRFGGHVHPQSLNKIITRAAGTNPHSLRHAGATAAYRGTGDVRSVQELLGHVSLDTTQRYVHVSLETVRAAADAGALGVKHRPLTAIEAVPFRSREGVA